MAMAIEQNGAVLVSAVQLPQTHIVVNINALQGCNMDRFTTLEVERALQHLVDWELNVERNAISRKFVFVDFNEAFAFMQSVAVQARVLDHHPEWCNVYNAVSIRWTSHDTKTLSQRDITMATYCDEQFASIQGAKFMNPSLKRL